MSTATSLVERLTQELNYPLLNLTTLDDFLAKHQYSVLFFTEDANRIPETNDVAIILPELIKSFPQLTPAVVAREDEEALKARYGFLAWPALVFMYKDIHIDTIARVQDWGYYIDKIKQIMLSAKKKSTEINIPIQSI